MFKLGVKNKDFWFGFYGPNNPILVNNSNLGGYLRFGRLPRRGLSFNHHEKFKEKGISVYEYSKIGKFVIPVLNNLNSSTILDLNKKNRPVFIVFGKKIKPLGSDGEILLKNCKIIKRVRLFN